MVMDLSLFYLRSYLKSLKLISLSILVVLWLKYPKNRDTASGYLSEVANLLNRGSLYNSCSRSSLSILMKLPFLQRAIQAAEPGRPVPRSNPGSGGLQRWCALPHFLVESGLYIDRATRGIWSPRIFLRSRYRDRCTRCEGHSPWYLYSSPGYR